MKPKKGKNERIMVAGVRRLEVMRELVGEREEGRLKLTLEDGDGVWGWWALYTFALARHARGWGGHRDLLYLYFLNYLTLYP